jgi:hypothetical protein
MAYNGSKAQAGRGTALFIASGTALAAPGPITATPETTGGTLAAGEYFYKVTALNANGETTGSPEANATTTGATGSVQLTWTAITGATSYNVYRGTTAGGESVVFNTATASFTDTGAEGAAGTVPTVNTTNNILIGEIKTSGIENSQWETEDVTNFQSGSSKEFITTIRDEGECQLDGNRVSSDAGQAAVEAAYASGLIMPFTLQLPKSDTQTVIGDKYQFNALVVSRSFKVETTKATSWSVKLKISGLPVETLGS